MLCLYVNERWRQVFGHEKIENVWGDNDLADCGGGESNWAEKSAARL